MKQFGFIGMGNMGYAILKGLLKKVDRISSSFQQETKSIWNRWQQKPEFLMLQIM